jgi:hypothetical protein
VHTNAYTCNCCAANPACGTTDSACGAGRVCDAGTCKTSNALPTVASACTSSTSCDGVHTNAYTCNCCAAKTGCAADTDCSGGDVCDQSLSPAACRASASFPAIPPSTTCTTGASCNGSYPGAYACNCCAENTCTGDADCGTGKQCTRGKCIVPYTGRVDYFQSNGADIGGAGADAASTGLWASSGELGRYSVIMLPCEGGANWKSAAEGNNVIGFGDAGGRVFATHYGYVWIAPNTGNSSLGGQVPWSASPGIATWGLGSTDDYNGTTDLFIDSSFRRTTNFAKWLFQPAVAASTTYGLIKLPQVRHDMKAVLSPQAERWTQAANDSVLGSNYCSAKFPPPASGHLGAACTLDTDCNVSPATGYVCDSNQKCTASVCPVSPGFNAPESVTFNTPLQTNFGKACTAGTATTACGPATQYQCNANNVCAAADGSQFGRVVYSDFHVSTTGTVAGSPFPAWCGTSPRNLTAGEKALEYMLFDLSSCTPADYIPPPKVFQAQVFTRDYTAVCPPQNRPVWHFFDWETVTPSDSSIRFAAQTADTAGALSTAAYVTIADVFGAPVTSFTGKDVHTVLAASSPPVVDGYILRISMTLFPSADKLSAPTLTAWRQSYDCVPAF